MNRASAERRIAGRQGFVLLEVLVALAIIGIVGSAAAWKTAELLYVVSRVHSTEADVRHAQRLLSAVSLWPREDLDRRLGGRRQGMWILHIERTTNDVYEIMIRDTLSGGTVLRTAVFRDREGGS
jgi:prepilin-type N-terminal cleavage/methylation domain-containing protein